MHDDDSFDYRHYVNDVFDVNTRIWWHCDDVNITEVSDFTKRVYIREITTKKNNVRL